MSVPLNSTHNARPETFVSFYKIDFSTQSACVKGKPVIGSTQFKNSKDGENRSFCIASERSCPSLPCGHHHAVDVFSRHHIVE